MTNTTTGHTATIEDVIKHYVAAEKERLKETGKYETTDDEMLKQEVQALFASIWNDGQMSLFPLEMTVETLVDNGFDTIGEDLENSLNIIKNNTNPYRNQKI